MDPRQHENTSRLSSTGEPRASDIAITVLTALILLVVLVVVAVL